MITWANSASSSLALLGEHTGSAIAETVESVYIEVYFSLHSLDAIEALSLVCNTERFYLEEYFHLNRRTLNLITCSDDVLMNAFLTLNPLLKCIAYSRIAMALVA